MLSNSYSPSANYLSIRNALRLITEKSKTQVTALPNLQSIRFPHVSIANHFPDVMFVSFNYLIIFNCRKTGIAACRSQVWMCWCEQFKDSRGRRVYVPELEGNSFHWFALKKRSCLSSWNRQPFDHRIFVRGENESIMLQRLGNAISCYLLGDGCEFLRCTHRLLHCSSVEAIRLAIGQTQHSRIGIEKEPDGSRPTTLTL